jgi:hypothetical protein
MSLFNASDYRDINRIKKIPWKSLCVWYNVENDNKNDLYYILIENHEELKKLQNLFMINDNYWLPTNSYTNANRIQLRLTNNESFVLIVGQSSLLEVADIVCYNNKNKTESYGMNIDTNFLIQLKHIIQTKSSNTTVRFPMGDTCSEDLK